MDRINARFAVLLAERAVFALEIARWKRARGLPVFDPARERAMIASILRAARPALTPAESGLVAQALVRSTRRMLRRRLREA